MSIATEPERKLMTAEEFLAIPDDGIARELIDGIVKERGMTLHNHNHAGVASNVVHLLRLWLAPQPGPKGKVVVGDCGFRLKRNPDRLVGPDVGFVSAELKARTDRNAAFYDGAPVLAVEILSPSDQHRDVIEKVECYLAAGSVVWEVDPDIQTVRVHRPGQLAEGFNASREIDADPYMPGLRVAVAAIFED